MPRQPRAKASKAKVVEGTSESTDERTSDEPLTTNGHTSVEREPRPAYAG